MYRITLSAALLLLSFNVSAQVTSPLLNCTPLEGDVAFTAKFNGQTATISFKGWTYELRFVEGWVGSQGVRWSYYENKEILVGTTFPLDKYVQVQTAPPRYATISKSNCR